MTDIHENDIELSGTVPSPYPFFGGKSAIARAVWERLGNPDNYIEPFFGSGAVLLQRPCVNGGTETVNDIDANISNFWRALQAEPGPMAELLDWPVNEADLIARHIWLVNTGPDRAVMVQGDPEYYDLKAAAWWCWGLCCWIGGGWCSGKGPWNTDGERLIDMRDTGDAAAGVWHQRPYLTGEGKGVHRKRPHLATDEKGVMRIMPHLAHATGRGVVKSGADLLPWMAVLAARLRRVRVCCGAWSRVLGPAVRLAAGSTCAVFLDPPYGHGIGRDNRCYSQHDNDVTEAVGAWALQHGTDKRMRIALCGYEGEYDLPGWDCVAWKARGGYSNSDNENCHRERTWYSPHCLSAQQGDLF